MEELPDSICWADGTAGTIDDYIRHSADTHRLDHDEHGWVKRIYPEIIAKVSFDAAARSWIVSSEWLPTESLELSDPNASDERIRGCLYAMPMMYKAEILRT